MPAAPTLFCSHVVELGGAEHVLLDVLEGLDRDRFAPHLAVPGDGPLAARAQALGVPVHPVPIAGRSRPGKLVAVLRAARALRRLAGDLGCRVLVANSMIAGYAAVLARHRQLAAVWHLHIVTDSRLARWGLRRADLVVAPARAALVAAGIGARGHVLPNAVPERFFAVQKGGLRARLGVPDATPLLGIVGRLDPDKGHELLLRAIAALPATCRPHLAIAGGELFTASQPRLAGFGERLRSSAAAAGLGERVHWLGELADTAPLLAGLDALVVPSTAPECAPRTIVEAQAVGCPVVASRVGGIPELIADGETGLLFDAGDERALAAALRRLIEVPALREALAAAGRSRALADHRRTQFTTRYADLLAGVQPTNG